MAKRDYTSFDVMLPQGARSRHMKLLDHMERASDLVPDYALAGTSADLRQALKHLQEAVSNLSELIVYRKMMGVD